MGELALNMYSPHGRWWWDGERWVPVYRGHAVRRPPPSPGGGQSRARPRAWPWVALAALTAVAIVVTAVAATTSVFPPATRKLILGGGNPPVPHLLTTAPPPGADAIPTVSAPPPPAGAPLDVRAVTARVTPATVNITVELHYGFGEAGGSGIILSPSGLVLTDEHVIFEADSITAQVGGAGRVYSAALIGADPADDVALLQLQHASGLATATFGTASETSIGAPVLVIGYPEDSSAVVVRGKVTGFGVSSMVEPEGDWPGAQVTGMLETSARVINGQSGGPVVDSAGRVLGVLESGSDGGGALATPAETALQVATQIAGGQASPRIVIGLPAELGVRTIDAGGSPAGAQVVAVHANTPAQAVGLHFGDVITTFGGTDITSALELARVLVRYHPGDRVSLTWTGLLGIRHQGSVTLTPGPGP